MPSPFPGMNPYLESRFVWNDFHTTFIPALREVLTQKVAPKYFVGVQERLYLRDSDENSVLVGIPDVDVTFRFPKMSSKRGGRTATLRSPVKGTIPRLKKRKSSYLEVFDTQNRTVVTVIELLSPANKYAGEDRDSYLAKRRELFTTNVNLIEIDLLRGGPRMPLKGLPPCAYCVTVSRPSARPEIDMWPIPLREPLPRIPIPLRVDEDEADVDLQALLNRVYDGAGYEQRIYEWEPEPQLAPADAAWAKEILAGVAK